ncbi:hypothetical protein [Luteimonas huabeiensis]|uniref:hypothetical protein n=1 Tax=Luteimonas huabeiensis TaxID=1244513 RepID=UPI000464E2D4|nr:hypothetical protein [Luteimonas huabeiensis]
MKMKHALRLAAGCMLALAGGFGVTAWAQSNWCETCHMGCGENYSQCMASGRFTPSQCAQSYQSCIIYDCNNCLVP